MNFATIEFHLNKVLTLPTELQKPYLEAVNEMIRLSKLQETNWHSRNDKGKKRKREEKKLSLYQQFMKENFPIAKAENPTLTTNEIFKLLCERWRGSKIPKEIGPEIKSDGSTDQESSSETDPPLFSGEDAIDVD